MKTTIYCQSCGMPLELPEHFGTCEDGSASREYCRYCYRDGAFTAEYTMEEMIDHCLLHLDAFNKKSETQLTPAEARAGMERFFPTLKRWSRVPQRATDSGDARSEESAG